MCVICCLVEALKKLNSYLTVNTHYLHYKNRNVSFVQGNNLCFFVGTILNAGLGLFVCLCVCERERDFRIASSSSDECICLRDEEEINILRINKGKSCFRYFRLPSPCKRDSRSSGMLISLCQYLDTHTY